MILYMGEMDVLGICTFQAEPHSVLSSLTEMSPSFFLLAIKHCGTFVMSALGFKPADSGENEHPALV